MYEIITKLFFCSYKNNIKKNYICELHLQYVIKMADKTYRTVKNTIPPKCHLQTDI